MIVGAERFLARRQAVDTQRAVRRTVADAMARQPVPERPEPREWR